MSMRPPDVTRAPGELSFEYERAALRRESMRAPWSPVGRSAARLADHAPWTPIRPA